jgi:hypothetical protein
LDWACLFYVWPATLFQLRPSIDAEAGGQWKFPISDSFFFTLNGQETEGKICTTRVLFGDQSRAILSLA